MPGSNSNFFTKKDNSNKNIFNKNKQGKKCKNKPQEYAHKSNQLSKAVMIIQNVEWVEKKEFFARVPVSVVVQGPVPGFIPAVLVHLHSLRAVGNLSPVPPFT